MARKADDLLADLDDLENEGQQAITPSTTTKASTKGAAPTAANDADAGEDALADIEKQLATKRATGSRPETPRLSSSATSVTNKSDKRAEFTPASTSVGSSQRNSSEDRVRSNAGMTASSVQGPTTVPDPASTPQQKASGGGWWGSMFNAATAAVKQAETLAKELRGNEEAQRWAEQVRGNIQNLQSLGECYSLSYTLSNQYAIANRCISKQASIFAPALCRHSRLSFPTLHPPYPLTSVSRFTRRMIFKTTPPSIRSFTPFSVVSCLKSRAAIS